jgi:uncharacterized protein (TIGR00299 family) protein
VKTLFFDCFSGASGDMILGGLVDAGADQAEIMGCLEALELPGWQVSFHPVTKNGIAATKAVVEVIDDAHSRTFTDLVAIVVGARLPDEVKRLAIRILTILGEAEAEVHGTSLEAIHLHEAGGHDALIDIVGSAAALVSLGAERVVVSPIATGRGSTHSAHGTIPVPGPAVLEILRGAPIESRGSLELITPTGAAILAAVGDSYGALPAMTVASVGYGAGEREGESLPNVLRVVVGDTDPGEVTDRLLLETNIDDMSPELVPYAIERLLATGAEDAWASPIVMKKGRPALTLSVLAPPASLDEVLTTLYRETTTFGVRIRGVGKNELDRRWGSATIEGHEVRVKIGTHKGEDVTRSVEYEDAAKVARITGLPLAEIYRRALESEDRSPSDE